MHMEASILCTQHNESNCPEKPPLETIKVGHIRRCSLETGGLKDSTVQLNQCNKRYSHSWLELNILKIIFLQLGSIVSRLNQEIIMPWCLKNRVANGRWNEDPLTRSKHCLKHLGVLSPKYYLSQEFWLGNFCPGIGHLTMLDFQGEWRSLHRVYVVKPPLYSTFLLQSLANKLGKGL